MPTSKRLKTANPEPKRTVDRKPRNKRDKTWRDKAWDNRLRTVGDARFTEVQWSGRDAPSWPLPKN
jgi:hypothetical protein